VKAGYEMYYSFSRLIKKLLKFIFPEKYHKSEKRNEQRPSETRNDGNQRVEIQPTKLSKAVQPVSDARRTDQEPELQFIEPDKIEDREIEELDLLSNMPGVNKINELRMPKLFPFKPETEEAEGGRNSKFELKTIKILDPQINGETVTDVDETIANNLDSKTVENVKDKELSLHSTELARSEINYGEGFNDPELKSKVNDAKNQSTQKVEEEASTKLEEEKPEPHNTKQIAIEVDNVEKLKLLQIEQNITKCDDGNESESLLDESATIEIENQRIPDVRDDLEEQAIIEENKFDEYEEVEIEDPDLSHSTSQEHREVIKNKEKIVKNSRRYSFNPVIRSIKALEKEEPDIDSAIISFESENLDDIFDHSINWLEKLLWGALKEYEYIGDLPISENAYKKLIEFIHREAYGDGEIDPRNTTPTIFVVSMVFCARYSDIEAREFWNPYAQQVWGTEPSPHFQNICRDLFIYSREYLKSSLNLSFDIKNEGDVVRPVYQHAIIPSYLQSNFAEWLVNNFETLLQYPAEELSKVLQDDKSLDYVPITLKKFICNEDTNETAARLIFRMSNAIKLIHETEQPELVESILNSPIEKSLWKVIYKKLVSDQSNLIKLRRIAPKLKWLWNLKTVEIYLKLSNIRSVESGKPDSVVWAEKDAKYLGGNHLLTKVYPWKTRSGGWELDPIIIPAEGPLDGSILVLSENFNLDEDKQSQNIHIIFESSLPSLQEPIMYFYVDPRKNTAIQKEKINSDGSWIIVSREDVNVKDGNGNKVKMSLQYLPYQLLESGFIQAGMYNIQLPVSLQLNEKSIFFGWTENKQEINPFLHGTEKVPGLSTDIPLVFLSPNINFQFSINPNFLLVSRTWLVIRWNGEVSQTTSLADLLSRGKMRIDENCCVIDLSTFVEKSGAYSINLFYNMRSLLDEPIQFAWLPEDVKIIGPSPDVCYSPINPPQVIITGVTEEEISTTHDYEFKIKTDGDEIKIKWDLTKNSYCQFKIFWRGFPIQFKWDIDRVSAWIEGGVDKNQVFEGCERDVILQVRGQPNEVFSWIIGEMGERQRYSQLNAKGEFQTKLIETEVRDMLLEDKQAKSTVSIVIRGYSWRLFDFYKKPKIEGNNIRYRKPTLSFSLTQERKLFGEYTIQIRQTIDQSKPKILCITKDLKDNFTFQIYLNPGNYRIEILSHDTLVYLSPIFQVVEELEQIKKIGAKFQELNDNGSPEYLFRVLTATESELLIQSYDKLPITPAIKQLQLIHTPDEWLTDAGWNDGLKRLLPTWAVLMYPIRFTTKKHRKVLYIFPEKAAYGATAGRGYIELKLEEEKKRIAASWRPGKDQGFSHLWMGVPQKQDVRFFSELDQDDLWPAYQCIDCGTIVASKDGTYLKLPPSVVQMHRHNIPRKREEQFIDTVYDKKNIVEGSITQYKEKPLQHAYLAKDVVYKNCLRLLNEGNILPVRGDLDKPINLFENIDYIRAVSDLYINLQLPANQKLLEHSNTLDKLNQSINEKSSNIPAFNAMQRLMNYVREESKPNNIPGNVLSMAMVLRFKAHYSSDYGNLLRGLGILESDLVEILKYIAYGCPKMLEWSIAWAELFYVHAIS